VLKVSINPNESSHKNIIFRVGPDPEPHKLSERYDGQSPVEEPDVLGIVPVDLFK
jgi:hypothetical protein